jgi:formylglycine-generating enzyme required for sulfatase activity
MRVVAVGVLLILGAMVPAPAAAGARQDGPKKVALLVGINQYKARKLADNPLRFAERDARELGAILERQGFDQVKVLTGADANLDAINTNLAAILKDRAAADLVLIGFAGHGVQMPLVDEQGRLVRDEQGRELSEAYFCPVNAVSGRPDTMVSLTRLMERLNREGGVNLIMVDACRDDPGEAEKRGLRSFSGNELVGRVPNNSAILFSCSAGQQALETDQAGGGHGVFFYHVIEGLKGRAADPDTGEVAWDDLVSFLRKNVNKRAREWDPKGAAKVDESPRTRGLLQNPHMIGNLVATPVLARVDLARRAPAEATPGPTAAAPEFITTGVGQIKLKRIPAGTFMMGSDATDPDAEDDEFVDKAAGRKEKHRVRITRAFYLGAYEVTQAQYKAVMGNNPSYFSATGEGKDKVAGQSTDQHPVETVSWLDAVQFCNKLNAREGFAAFYEIDGDKVSVPDWNRPGYRLPTEAEWEYACRANTSTRYSFGDDAASLGEFGWFDGNSGDKSHAVGEKRPNGFGLYDMHGNVWEWCWDGYDDAYYKSSPEDDPRGGEGASIRVGRGGGWNDDPRYVRSANRYWFVPGGRDSLLGFRVALVQSAR